MAGVGYFIIYLAINKYFYNFESLELLGAPFQPAVTQVVLILVINGLVSSVLGFFLYIEALNRLKSALTVNVLFALSIPISVLIDYHRGQVHSVTPSFLIGALLVLASTVLVPFEKPTEGPTGQTQENVIQLADPEVYRDIPLLIFQDGE